MWKLSQRHPQEITITRLKPIFVGPELKKLIEFYKTIKGFKEINSALTDLLKSSDKYLGAKKAFNLVEPEEITEEIELGVVNI